MRTASGPRVGWMFAALLAFLGLWLLVVPPPGWVQTALLAALAFAFAYAVLGLCLEVPVLIGMGSAMAALALAGYLLARPDFGIWMAVSVGGGLLAGGSLLLARGIRG
jgi:hypothetical protein